MMADHPSMAGYAENATKLVADYEKQPFESVFASFLHMFPEKPGAVLDIGAGSGRHAAALARRGHTVTAVEPVREMRDAGMKIHAKDPIIWVDDTLPELRGLRQMGILGPFDLILMAGVMMHFDEQERQVIMRRLAELLGPGGRFIVTYRHGPIPEGRRMFDVSLDNAVLVVSSHGFKYMAHVDCPDHSGRKDVSWTIVCFDKSV